jgi:hypothetical protein
MIRFEAILQRESLLSVSIHVARLIRSAKRPLLVLAVGVARYCLFQAVRYVQTSTPRKRLLG